MGSDKGLAALRGGAKAKKARIVASAAAGRRSPG
jgi:hypothetical protein